MKHLGGAFLRPPSPAPGRFHLLQLVETQEVLKGAVVPLDFQLNKETPCLYVNFILALVGFIYFLSSLHRTEPRALCLPAKL